MRRNPVEFLRFVAGHYQLLVELCKENRGFQSDDEINAFIHSHSAVTNAGKIVSQMKRLGILNQNTAQWTLPPFLKAFLASLQERHILATPEVVRAWVDKLSSQTLELDNFVNKLGVEQSQIAFESGQLIFQDISDTINIVFRTIGENIERIGQEVAAYRNTENAAIMRFRLRQLVKLYENYLLPVMEILDTSGKFQAVCQQIIKLCTQIDIQGHILAEDARNLRQQVAWLQRSILQQADEASKELAPLCMAAVRESTIARGVNRALQSIQNGKWEQLNIESLIPIVYDQDSSLAGDDAISSFMQIAFDLREQTPPRISADEPELLAIPISPADIKKQLNAIEHIDDVLLWIKTQNAEYSSASNVINLIHQLSEIEPLHLKPNASHANYEFEQVSVKTCKWTWNLSNEQ
jgi:hypothetical protein